VLLQLRGRHPFLFGLVISLLLTGICLGITIAIVDGMRAAELRDQRALSEEALGLLAQGIVPPDSEDLSRWLVPEFRVRGVVSRSEPAEVEFAFTVDAATYSTGEGLAQAPIALWWVPRLVVNGKEWTAPAPGGLLRYPEDFDSHGRHATRYPVALVLGDELASDAVTVEPQIEFVLARLESPAGVLPGQLPPPPANGRRWHWTGGPLTLFVYDHHPADYPRAVTGPELDVAMGAASTPESVEFRRLLGAGGHRSLQFTFFWSRPACPPEPLAAVLELGLPGGATTVARGHIVIPKCPEYGAPDFVMQTLELELQDPPSADEQAFLLGLQSGTLKAVRLVLRGSRERALQEPDLDQYWGGTLDVEVPIGRPPWAGY
jgi:hypothetical protein